MTAVALMTIGTSINTQGKTPLHHCIATVTKGFKQLSEEQRINSEVIYGITSAFHEGKNSVLAGFYINFIKSHAQELQILQESDPGVNVQLFEFCFLSESDSSSWTLWI